MMPNGAQIEFESHVRVSEGLRRWLRKLVSPPKERFRTASEALAALDNLGALKSSEPNRMVAILVACGVAVALIIGGAIALRGSAAPEAPVVVAPPPPQPPPPPERTHHGGGAIVDGFDDTATHPRAPTTDVVQPSVPSPPDIERRVMQSELEMVLLQHEGELNRCGQFSAREQTKVTLEFAITPDGKMEDVRIIDPHQIPELDRCVLEAAKGWQFPLLHPKERQTVQVPLVISH
jgi:TonB family protein